MSDVTIGPIQHRESQTVECWCRHCLWWKARHQREAVAAEKRRAYEEATGLAHTTPFDLNQAADLLRRIPRGYLLVQADALERAVAAERERLRAAFEAWGSSTPYWLAAYQVAIALLADPEP